MNIHRSSVLSAITATVLALSGIAHAQSDVVVTNSGRISGETVQEAGQPVRIFRGVPYAAPPVGELRWQAPQPTRPWSDLRDATEWSDRCPQGESSMGASSGISEDCLYLNVVTPAEASTERLPVMVFFHGGGLTSGTANSPLYNNTALPAKGVVVVTVNSRLGPIGYMAHPALSGESEHGVSGNYGTLDLIASLEWVQDNITAFGGDPDNVTIFGESGGGTKTISLMSSPLADGLFHKAIVESGSASVSPQLTTTLEEGEAAGERIAAEVGAESLEDLRSADWQDLIEAAGEVEFPANIVVDGRVLPESVNELFSNGEQHDVPLIVGANEGESSLQSNVPLMANLMSNNSSADTYVYNFSHVPTGWREQPCVAFHGLELPYVFGYVPEGLTTPTILFLSQGGGCEGDDPGSDDMDLVVADQTMQLWASFARDGDPSVEGLVDWPAYTEDNDRYLDIGYELEMRQGIRDAYVAPPE